MFCIASNCATLSLQGTHAIRFFRLLDPLHMPPHRVVFMRLTRLLEQAVFREFHWIVTDNAFLYGLDFYTNKERCETYGCLVSNMLSQQYVFKVSFLCCFVLFRCVHLTLSLSLLSSGAGQLTSVYVSNRSYNEGAKNLVVLEASEKTNLETVIAFQKFSDSKTGKNIAIGFFPVI
jgi:hypothetical protein